MVCLPQPRARRRSSEFFVTTWPWLNDQLDLRFGLSLMESPRPVRTSLLADDFGDLLFGC